MSDTDTGGVDPGSPTTEALTEAQLRESVDDPAMTMAEKQALLERYARAMGPDRPDGEGAVLEPLEPLEAQIAEALALLGAGGHRTG